jgi:uncharacterized protein YciI
LRGFLQERKTEMPLFSFYARDQPDGPALREANRQAHMDNMSRLDREGRLVFAGPLKDREGGKSVGSLIVFEAASEQAARELMESDPYTRAGVFEWHEILPTLKAFPKSRLSTQDDPS